METQRSIKYRVNMFFSKLYALLKFLNHLEKNVLQNPSYPYRTSCRKAPSHCNHLKSILENCFMCNLCNGRDVCYFILDISPWYVAIYLKHSTFTLQTVESTGSFKSNCRFSNSHSILHRTVVVIFILFFGLLKKTTF